MNKKRLSAVIVSETISYATVMAGLNSLWYSDYPRTSFHFFNDNDEWLQMDKAGHALTAFQAGRAGEGLLRWSGMEQNKSRWYGGTLGLLFLTSVEVFDGFSSAWGASGGDLIANASGTALFITQQWVWGETRIDLKFSAHPSPFARYRPGILGSTWTERLLKDYNGQTYWASVNIHSFLAQDARFPRWLNVAIGYSGDEMIKGDVQHYIMIDEQGQMLEFSQQRQFFLSLDIDLARLVKKPGLAKTLFGTFGFIKIPAPALEYNSRDGFCFRIFYF